MNETFFKFPSTPHIAVLGGIDVRHDKTMSEAEVSEFIQHELIIEEKIDGANLGVSFDASGNIRLQNRGAYLQPPFTGQWKKLAQWLELKTDIIFDHLTDRYILFGEWCYAQHSVAYEKLPDWFVGFDIYDKEKGRFFSCNRRDIVFRKMQISPVPEISRGHFTLSTLRRLLSTSQFSDHAAEGLYLRLDQGGWLIQRAKLVRPAFIQSVEEHWTRTGIKANHLVSEDWG